MPPKIKTPPTRDQKKIQKQKKALEHYKTQDRWLKWATAAAIVIIILLLILLGFATDWLSGLHKDKTTKNGTPISSSLDTLKTGSANDTSGGGSTNTGSSGSSTDSTTTGGGSDTSTTTRTNTGSSTNSTTTNNSSTTTTNNTTTTDQPDTPPSGLLNLYANSSVGDSINDLLQHGTLVGVSGDCHTDVLIQVCNFTQGNYTITTRNILGTGLITSLTKNF